MIYEQFYQFHEDKSFPSHTTTKKRLPNNILSRYIQVRKYKRG